MELKELRGEDMSSEKTTMKSLGDSTALREKFCEFSQAALNKVNEIYVLLSKPCIVIEDVRQLCREARAILYNPPVTETPPRNCDRFNTGDPKKDAEDAYGAWQQYCDNPTIPPSCKVESAFKYWLFHQPMTAKEGEGDGSK